MARTEDSHLAKQAEATAAQLPGQGQLFDQVDMAIPEPLAAIPVRNESPARAVGRCAVLSAANPVLQLLPQDPRRRHALVLAVDNPVYLAASKDLAANAAGTSTGTDCFFLPVGVAVPIVNKAAWWVSATTTGTSSRVSSLVSLDDE